jgi:polysaccharide deacetylase 2 family uncharacterized protein YibQ
MLRIDGRTADEVRYVQEWVLADSFESVNVQSPGKLRKRYDQLAAKAGTSSGSGSVRDATQQELRAQGYDAPDESELIGDDDAPF